MEQIIYVAAGIFIGAILGWLIAKAITTPAVQAEKDAAQQKFSELEKEFVGYKASSTLQLQTANENLVQQATELKNLGLKTKKELPKELVNSSIIKELPEQINI